MNIISLLTSAGINAAESSNADPSTATTSVTLYELVNPLISGGCHPLRLPDEENPDEFAVYQPVGLDFIESDGYRLSRIDRYVLSLRSPSYTRLEQISGELIDKVADQTGSVSMDINDMAADYEPDQKQCRVHIDISAGTLASSIQWPACLVHRIGSRATENDLITGFSQTVTEQVAIVCVAPSDDIQTLRTQVAQAIIGQLPDETSDEYQYVSGQLIGISGPVVFWREIYSWNRYLRV